MKCAKCNNPDTKVVDSRIVDNWQTIRRRRECEVCGHRFTTFERVWVTELMVIKKDWSKEMYDRSKLKKAILLAFAKTDFTNEEIENLLNTLEIKWQSEWSEIQSSVIWDDVLELLKNDDKIISIDNNLLKDNYSDDGVSLNEEGYKVVWKAINKKIEEKK